MSDFYTSYETSVALRDAGAPQEAGDHDWAEQEGTEPMLVRADCFLLPGEVRGPRAFRADEIAKALTGRIDMLTPFKSGRWACRIKPASVPPGQVWVDDYFGDSMVEALAAAWRAVLLPMPPAPEAKHD